MKKIIFLMLSCAFVASMSAQTVTKNDMPKNMQGMRMNVQMDFSNAMILGMSETEFAKYEKDWNEDKPAIVRDFRNGANMAIGTKLSRIKMWATLTGRKLGSILKAELR
jgi:hypothetical protein